MLSRLTFETWVIGVVHARVIVTWVTDNARSDPLLQLLDLELQLFRLVHWLFHRVHRLSTSELLSNTLPSTATRETTTLLSCARIRCLACSLPYRAAPTWHPLLRPGTQRGRARETEAWGRRASLLSEHRWSEGGKASTGSPDHRPRTALQPVGLAVKHGFRSVSPDAPLRSLAPGSRLLPQEGLLQGTHSVLEVKKYRRAPPGPFCALYGLSSTSARRRAENAPLAGGA
jgi:hypothetical protein